MNKFTFGLAAFGALAFVALDSSATQAAPGFGLHIGGPNVRLNIGNPHGHARYHKVGYRPARPCFPPSRAWYHYGWHDTRHWDYRPGGYARHGNQFDFIPGHWSWQQRGDWDRHRRPHHGRHQ